MGKKKERRRWPWQKKPVPLPPPPHPDDFSREFYEAPFVPRRHRLRWTDQPRSAAARELEGTMANYVRQDSFHYKSHKLIQQMEEDAIRNEKLDADRAHMFDPTIPRLQRGSYLDNELRRQPPPRVMDTDPFINPVPRPQVKISPELNLRIMKSIHNGLKLYKGIYNHGTKAYKELYFMTKHKLLQQLEDEMHKRPEETLDPEGYAPSTAVSLERLDEPGKPRGILIRVDRWTKYKRREIPPILIRKAERKIMPAFTEFQSIGRLTPALFNNEDTIIVKEKMKLRGRRHPKNWLYRNFWWSNLAIRSLNRVNRKRILEFTFGDGFGLRLIIHVRPNNNNNYVMQCISQTRFGVPYFGWCIRHKVIHYILNNWNTYKYAAARGLMYCSEFFQNYDPEDPRESQHIRARLYYYYGFQKRLFDCKLVEIQVACRLYKINLCVLEMTADGRYYWRRAHTSHKKFIYFFAQQELDETRQFADHYITWLKKYHDPYPYIVTPQKYLVHNCQMMLTYHVRWLYFWRFTEVEPSYYDPPIPKRHMHHLFLRRNRTVRFTPWVDVLKYFDERPPRWWVAFARKFGYCPPNYGPDKPKYRKPMTQREMFSGYMKRWKKLHKKSRYRDKTPEQRANYIARVEEYIKNARKATSTQVFEQQQQPSVKKWEKSIKKVTHVNRMASSFRADAVARAMADEAAAYRVKRKIDRRERRRARKQEAMRTESNNTY